MAKTFISPASIAIALSLVSLVLAVPDDVAASSTHDPIMIKGNHDLTAANGITGGSGTADDPYIIEGWQITAATTPGIQIIGTSAYLVIKNISIQGSAPTPSGPRGGIYLERVSNAEIDNVEVTMCWMGIFAYMANHVVIKGCIAHDNGMGIRLTWSKDVTIEGNTVFSNWMNGIGVAASRDCVVRGNMMSENGAGLDLQGSASITVSGNVFTQDGITISGTKLSEFDSHSITTDNIVGGLPVYYFTGLQAVNIEGLQAGEIIVVGCEGVRLDRLTLTGSSMGVEIAFCEWVSLVFCDFLNNHRGLYITESQSVSVMVCNFTGNSIGASISSSESILVQDCRFIDNLGEGLAVFISSDVRVQFSTFTDNDWALSLSECSDGFVSANNITANNLAIYLGSCSKTTVAGNDITQSTWLGMQIWGGKKVIIYQNNFIGNGVHVTVYDPGDIAWNSDWGFGNYWDDYSGTDANNDQIGDTPYVIDSDNQDDYPCMFPIIW